MSALGERSVRIREVEGSNPFRSTKQGLDEHLFLQRRLRRAVFALIRNRKAPSWNYFRDGAFLLSAHSLSAISPATMVAERNRRLYKFTFFPYTVRPCATGADFLAGVKFPYISIKGELRKLRLISHEFPLFFGILPKKRNKNLQTGCW